MSQDLLVRISPLGPSMFTSGLAINKAAKASKVDTILGTLQYIKLPKYLCGILVPVTFMSDVFLGTLSL